MKKNWLDSFMKVIVAIIVCHGLICVTASYILAFIGKEMIAESLSETVIKEIMAPVIVYGIKSTIENISKYNGWVDKIVNRNYTEELEIGTNLEEGDSNE